MPTVGAMTGRDVPPAGTLLRSWRQRRRLSQADLALAAGTSTRHLSCVETGRARPSRGMVLRLAETLEVPLRDRNQILLGGGLAPAYPDAGADPAARRRLLETLDLVLAAHEPWPALVLDAGLDVVATNRALDRFLAPVDPALLEPPVNVVRLTLHPRGLAPHVVDLPAWRDHLLRQLRRHADSSLRADLRELLVEVATYPCAPQPATASADAGPTFALPLRLRVGTDELCLLSSVATFGTPLDVAASELAIETFLPADAATRAWLERAARG